MQARRGHVGVRRGFLDQRDVADAATAGDGAFDQVVTEHLRLGQAPAQRGVHRRHMQEALAGEGAHAVEVLVHFGAGGAVGVHATLAGKQPVEGRALTGRGERRGQARLQDAVAGNDAPPLQLRPVQRVRGDAHQGT